MRVFERNWSHLENGYERFAKIDAALAKYSPYTFELCSRADTYILEDRCSPDRIPVTFAEMESLSEATSYEDFNSRIAKLKATGLK